MDSGSLGATRAEIACDGWHKFSGWRSLECCRTSPEVVWNALFDLCAVSWELFAGDAGIDVQRVFNERSAFGYAYGNIGPRRRTFRHMR